MKDVFAGFKAFVLRGNAVDLAVGVVIGAAFGAVVTAIVDDLIDPVIGAIFGKPDLSNVWDITLRPAHDGIAASVVSVGGILNALLQFVLIAASVYFVIVLPMNALAKRRAKDVEEEPAAPAEDVLVLREIRDLLTTQSGDGSAQSRP